MSNKKLIGNYLVHDSFIEEVNLSKNVLVKLITQDKRKINFEFINLQSIKIQNIIGMILYSITEEDLDDIYKKYTFINWDEDSDGFMEIIAEKYVFENI